MHVSQPPPAPREDPHLTAIMTAEIRARRMRDLARERLARVLAEHEGIEETLRHAEAALERERTRLDDITPRESASESDPMPQVGAQPAVGVHRSTGFAADATDSRASGPWWPRGRRLALAAAFAAAAATIYFVPRLWPGTPVGNRQVAAEKARSAGSEAAPAAIYAPDREASRDLTLAREIGPPHPRE